LVLSQAGLALLTAVVMTIVSSLFEYATSWAIDSTRIRNKKLIEYEEELEEALGAGKRAVGQGSTSNSNDDGSGSGVKSNISNQDDDDDDDDYQSDDSSDEEYVPTRKSKKK